MKVCTLTLVVCVCFFNLVACAKYFKFEDCSKGKGIATIRNFKLSPDPISLKKNVLATVDITLNEDVPPNSFVKNRIYKVTSLFGIDMEIPAPCINGTGSCTTATCEYLGALRDQVCPFVPPDQVCGCHLKAGDYRGTNVTITMPQLNSLQKTLLKGNFKIEWRLVKKEDSTEKQLICLNVIGKVVA